MLREYEVTIIAKLQTSADELKKVMERYESLFHADSGDIIRKEDWGVRKMAHEINKSFKAHYLHYDINTTSKNLAETERLMRLDENILRYLTVRVGENVDVEKRRVELETLAQKKLIKPDMEHSKL